MLKTSQFDDDGVKIESFHRKNGTGCTSKWCSCITININIFDKFYSSMYNQNLKSRQPCVLYNLCTM